MLDLSHINLAGALVSEKLDGIQGIWDGRRLTTRDGNPIYAPDWFTASLPLTRLVGELWCGRGNYEVALSITGSHHAGDRWRQVRFSIFDGPPGIPLPDHCGYVAQYPADDRAFVRAFYVQVLARDGEGIIIRTADGDRHKFKPLSDDVARVVDFTYGNGRNARRVGSLMVADRDGHEFRLGNGLTDEDRSNPPPIGSLVEYQFEGRTKNGIPRFARFRRRRAERQFV